jgi:NADPH:quinone reductase-like Zn-dependent oxidoreductase
MKAIVQEGSGSADALHVRDVEVPVPAAGRVLVRVRAASVNAADWHTVHGGLVVKVVGRMLRQPPQHPIRGSDLAGVVEAVGPDVEGVTVGDEVFGVGLGSFAEHATARPAGLALKPAALSFADAAAIPIAGCTALRGLRDTGRLKAGERVLVFGAGGGVGTFAVQVASALGGSVTAVTSSANVDVVSGLPGVAEVLSFSEANASLDGRRFDVVFDVAATRSLSSMLRLLAPGGRMVLAGAAKGGMFAIASRLLAATVRERMGQSVKSFLARVTRADLDILAEFAEQGKLRPTIDRSYPLEEAVEAVRYVGTGKARAKVVITVGSSS